jgi:uncharacterized membrane protein
MVSDTRTISQAHQPQLAVRRIALADLGDALARGIDDFRAMPTHLFILGLIYPIGTLVAALLVFDEGLLQLVFPLVSGGALLGPFVALGMYEISRRRERGLELHWSNVFEVRRSPARGAIAVLGLMLVILFVGWLYAALVLYRATLGDIAPESFGGFATALFTTGAGWALIVVGNLVGFVFAVAALTMSVVSFPLLLDRHVGVGTAIETSVRAVMANPVQMAAWGLLVAGLLLLGALPLFVGLAVVLPVLGHATWHLYRKVVEA